tara:strand:- start:25030 stop:26463 length:1434 start_codon:yes stop_codon:yes gene_type:complete
MKIIPVIMCGGKGTRLWPLSRESYPKQFLSLSKDTNKSLLQQTLERISSLENIQKPILICNEEHRFLVAEQVRNIGILPNAIILEPFGRNTAPAITLGALQALNIDKESILLVLSADHKIEDNEEFIKVVKLGIKEAERGSLVVFGVIPTTPETGYGYIESKEPLNSETNEAIPIRKFIEKPNKVIAEKLYRNKKYSWNSGIFIFETKIIIEELQKFTPELVSKCKSAFEKSQKDLDFTRIDSTTFKDTPNIPIDIAVMEKTKLGSVLPLKAGWSDIGSWKSLWESEKKDLLGNVIKGKVVDFESENCFLTSENRLLVTLGLKDTVAVETSDAILVANKEHAKNLKEVINKLDAKGFQEGRIHKKVYRPWGAYTSLIEDTSWQVKKIEVNPGAKLSLQMHHHRSEHWIVANGTATVQINNEIFVLSENQSTFIPLGAKHRLSNPGKIPLILIEIQSGNYLGEDDIVRFEDDYGRIIN